MNSPTGGPPQGVPTLTEVVDGRNRDARRRGAVLPVDHLGERRNALGRPSRRRVHQVTSCF